MRIWDWLNLGLSLLFVLASVMYLRNANRSLRHSLELALKLNDAMCIAEAYDKVDHAARELIKHLHFGSEHGSDCRLLRDYDAARLELAKLLGELTGRELTSEPIDAKKPPESERTRGADHLN